MSIDSKAACAQVPILRQDYVDSALVDVGGGDLDVDAILQGYIRQFQQRGGVTQTGCEVNAIHYNRGQWAVSGQNETYQAPIMINAAGAWADDIAKLAGLTPLGIKPLRRTACLVELPDTLDANNWPLVIDADEQFYFKPDAGLLLISPANESPSAACDAQPEDLDVALAVDRICTATTLEIRRIQHKWAGLRSFVGDKTFVAGFDPRATGFFWLAGQGGYGVQSAPALANIASHLVTDVALAKPYQDLVDTIEAIKPDRLIQS